MTSGIRRLVCGTAYIVIIIGTVLGLTLLSPTLKQSSPIVQWMLPVALIVVAGLLAGLIAISETLHRERKSREHLEATVASNARMYRRIKQMLESFPPGKAFALMTPLFLAFYAKRGPQGEAHPRWGSDMGKVDARTFLSELEELARKQGVEHILDCAERGEPPFDLPDTVPVEFRNHISKMFIEATR